MTLLASLPLPQSALFAQAVSFSNPIVLGLLLLLTVFLITAIVLGIMSFLQNKKLTTAQSQLAELQAEHESLNEELSRVRAEADEAVSVAERSSQAKGTFLATMSHEVRTPLNCILGLSEVLMATDPTEEQRDHLETIRSSVNALLGIIGNVLDYSKIEAGHLDLRPERFSLNDMVDDIGKLFKVQADSKKLDFECRLEPDAPFQINADKNHFRQILVNLIGNAMKFTEEGSVKLVITRDRIPPEETPTPGKVFYHLVARVYDTGIGIPDDKKEDLFKPFHQLVESKTRKYEGTGLGLAICQRIVQEGMNGEIIIRDNEPQGSIFEVHLAVEGFPVKKPSSPKKKLGSDASGLYQHALGASFYQHKILVADDNNLNCRVMKAMLEKMGHQADFVNNGFEAVLYLRRNEVDLVFMDIMMPVMDGLEATVKIREGEAGEASKNIPVVALTAFALTSDKERFLSSGMDYYLSKPVEPELLREVLTKLARDKSKANTAS